ncbi:MAG: DEAD/DEAH box helicase, partial [Myxococcota bacterium]|nr:DEAD/DEAH box helicase [Myxococcota bacterium]
MSFSDLGLDEAIQETLSDLGYSTPTPIQTETIPPLLKGLDLIGQAQTGTGKTAAFLLPIIARLSSEQSAPQALVLTPTRELAIQVAEAFSRYRGARQVQSCLLYGGQPVGPQIQQLRRRP